MSCNKRHTIPFVTKMQYSNSHGLYSFWWFKSTCMHRCYTFRWCIVMRCASCTTQFKSLAPNPADIAPQLDVSDRFHCWMDNLWRLKMPSLYGYWTRSLISSDTSVYLYLWFCNLVPRIWQPLQSNKALIHNFTSRWGRSNARWLTKSLNAVPLPGAV